MRAQAGSNQQGDTPRSQGQDGDLLAPVVTRRGVVTNALFADAAGTADTSTTTGS